MYEEVMTSLILKFRIADLDKMSADEGMIHHYVDKKRLSFDFYVL
jgi:hypothetical protein